MEGKIKIVRECQIGIIISDLIDLEIYFYNTLLN